MTDRPRARPGIAPSADSGHQAAADLIAAQPVPGNWEIIVGN